MTWAVRRDKPVIDVSRKINVLLPVPLLVEECDSFMKRTILEKKRSDAVDIEFLLGRHI